jgi:glycosyltransferase involved in cell wall biosynthesis
MRVAIASDIELGSHRAHAINVVKTAGGFARLGHEARVFLRGSGAGLDASEAARAYAEPDLEIELAPVPPPRRAEVQTPARQREFARWAVAEALAWGADVLYARHFETGLAGAAAGLPTVVETHAYVGDTNPALLKTLAASRESGLAVTTISPTLREYYIRRGADPGRVAVVPDGVDLEMFTPAGEPGPCPFSRGAWRAHAVYAGHLYDYKGTPTILEAAALAPDVAIELVGGMAEDVARVRERAAGLTNVRVHGMREYAQVPSWLWHADVLLLPPSAREPSAAWTSPVKLGEYLASGRPVVASRIPGLRTWVDEPVVRWFEPDSGRDMARAIEVALGESDGQREQRLNEARQCAERFSYRNRARQILDAALRPHPAGTGGSR